MKKIVLIIICSVVLFSCDENDSGVSNRQLLDQQFTGNYELISSVSDKAVDLNNDGSQSTNLLNENSMILLSSITIRIPYEKEHFLTDNEFVFSELWPTENDLRLKNKDVIKVDRTIDFNPNYDIYGNTLIGEF